MTKNRITGIIDIGSNTVRLAVYQLSDNGAYRVIDQGRWAARLSQRMDDEGNLTDEAIEELTEVLRHYRRICQMHGTGFIRTVATAAVRQSANRERIVRRLSDATGLTIEVLSGEDEARIGSHAMLCTMGTGDGFVIDIGGGSTEISLLLDREVKFAVSFPFGCVNLASTFALSSNPVPPAVLEDMQSFVMQRLTGEPWIGQYPGLPIIGLGGTVRALAKFQQKMTDYPFHLLHGYELRAEDAASRLNQLAAIPVDKRRKLPGLSKDRGDVIVPGLAILLGIIRHAAASSLVVCGAGLRDGLFYETCVPRFQPKSAESVLQESIRNLTALYPTSPEVHLNQVQKLAVTLYECLSVKYSLRPESRLLLETAARLHRIGAAIDYNNSAEHTFYMLMHTHWNGLGHREMLLAASIAAFASAGQHKRNLAPFRAILSDGDIELAARLGTLLQLASALDRSEAQAISAMDLVVMAGKLQIVAHASHPLPVEQRETDAIAREFHKTWGLTPKLDVKLQATYL
ncbi:Ppx/GppA phosphatase family protein [Cohnella panacarvi]|uniref:Ppx/GppA phosphatase family protein n=1 Tax=Cohnella panacarvi TaxID=400776 RepID=UPI00047EB5D0|nr:Ppx/GppA phosphatase family protein [Cohnella panacarvi]